MQCYKVTKSVTIHSFKVDPTRSSQRFCPSLTMLQILLQASPSSRMLETLAGLCCWARRSPASLTLAMLCTWRGTDGCYLGLYMEPPHVASFAAPLLFPGYFSIQVLTVHLLTFQSRAMQFSAEASLPLWWMAVTLYTTALALRRTLSKSLLAWALHGGFRFHHVRGLHFLTM